MIFQDRKDAGIRLADALEKYRGEDVIVYALPRGGVVLGAEIAKYLHAPLDLVFTKKIGHPGNPEYAICAITEKGEPLCDPSEVSMVDTVWLHAEVERTRTELRRRRKEYLGESKSRDLKGRTVILVDDGIATGLTMMAAIAEMKRKEAKRVVAAIPVTPYETALELKNLGVDLVSLNVDHHYLGAVGAYYMDFRQVEDNEVISILKSVNQDEETQ